MSQTVEQTPGTSTTASAPGAEPGADPGAGPDAGPGACAGTCAHHGLTRAGATRRAFLAGTTAAAGVAVLAACAPGADGGDDAPSGGGSEDGGSGGAAAGGLVALADVPVGGAVVATTANGDKVLVTQPAEGDVRCFSSVCTHQGCAVGAGDGQLECPCHGSAFDLDTGEPVTGPATEPLPAVAVEVRDGQVVEA